MATVCGFPASGESRGRSSNPADDAEFIVVPLEQQRPSFYNRYPSSFDDFDGVVDTGDFAHPVGNPVFFPSINPFTWHLSSYLDDLIKRLRGQFANSWNPFYDGGSDFLPSRPGVWPLIPDESPEDGQNTTSTVKVIDGHKVVINDTYYTRKNEFGTSIFKVRVIDVKPADGDSEGDSASTEKPVDTGNRAGTDADSSKDDSSKDDSSKDEPEPEKKEPAPTEAPKRDTELDGSDEDTTPADDSLNTIDSNSDIDSPKKEEDN